MIWKKRNLREPTLGRFGVLNLLVISVLLASLDHEFMDQSLLMGGPVLTLTNFNHHIHNMGLSPINFLSCYQVYLGRTFF